MVSLGRKDKAGQAGLRLADLNNCSRLWGIDAVPGYLISRAHGYIGTGMGEPSKGAGRRCQLTLLLKKGN